MGRSEHGNALRFPHMALAPPRAFRIKWLQMKRITGQQKGDEDDWPKLDHGWPDARTIGSGVGPATPMKQWSTAKLPIVGTFSGAFSNRWKNQRRVRRGGVAGRMATGGAATSRSPTDVPQTWQR